MRWCSSPSPAPSTRGSWCASRALGARCVVHAGRPRAGVVEQVHRHAPVAFDRFAARRERTASGIPERLARRGVARAHHRQRQRRCDALVEGPRQATRDGGARRARCNAPATRQAAADGNSDSLRARRCGWPCAGLPGDERARADADSGRDHLRAAPFP